eukprot:PITA_34231
MDLKGTIGHLGMMKITLKPNAKPVNQRPYRLNPKYKEKVHLEIDKMLAAGIIESVEESDWVSPMVVQEKNQKDEIRICVYLRKLNDSCVHDPFLAPLTNEVLDNLGGQEAYSFTDGFSRYHQIKIALEDRSKTTFETEWGCFQYTVMPFGLKNAFAIFSNVVVAVFKEFIHKFLKVSFDDWTIFGLGLMVDPANIAVILNLEALRSVKQLCTTLGHTGYYRKFIKSYAQITVPMEKLLKKDVTFCRNDGYKKILDILKENGVTAPILVFPDWKKEFHVHVDASCIALGAVLTQAGEEGLDHPIVFVSRRLSKVEKNYSTTEHEGLAMVNALQKYRHYLLGGHFKMYMDHSTLK